MNLELLPNETILDLFEYFSIHDLFHGFFNLNSRFNQLLCLQFQKFHLDLRLLSKTNFNHICQNYVPLITDRIISLYLSNVNDTPQGIELFLSHYYQLRQFTRLQSIFLEYLQSQQTLDRIMIECSNLSCLTHLSFTNCYIPMSESDANRLSNHIWSLKNLTYCYLKIKFAYENYFPNPTVISTPLKHLIVHNSPCSASTLTRLCQHTPNLRYLSTTFEDLSHQREFIFPIQSLTRTKICFYGSIDILEHLLQHMSNLRHLTFETYSMYINGYQWEEMIRKYLPELKIFQFKMSFGPLNNKDKQVQLNEIVDTYRTNFWINEHQWFVRGHFYILTGQMQSSRIELFTLPYTFDEFSFDTNCILSKSTSPNDDGCLTCDHVIDLWCGLLSPTSSSIECPVRFHNIQNLTLLFPLPLVDQFSPTICRLDQLTSLSVIVDTNHKFENIRTQLQLLLDQTPHLRSLSFHMWLPCISIVPLIKTTSIFVRRLGLQEYFYDNEWHSYNAEQCLELSGCALGKQCQTLLIKVKNRRNILDLVNNMPNLQALNVRCEDDRWISGNNIVSSIDDELLTWLREQLPSTCIITRDTHLTHDIRLWIR